MNNPIKIATDTEKLATILVVDDNLLDARLCQRTLERAAYRVFSATDPRTALDEINRQKFDLLLVDIYMPYLDGFELVRQAKLIQPDLTVLVMTGVGTMDDATRALEHGVDGLIIKPFGNGDQLVVSVRKALCENHQRRDALRLHTLRPLFDVTEKLNSEMNSVALLEMILSAIGHLFNVKHIGIYKLSCGNQCLEEIATQWGDQTAFGEHFKELDGVSKNRTCATELKGTPLPGEAACFGDLLTRDGGIPQEVMLINPGVKADQSDRLLKPFGLQSVMVVPVARKQADYLFVAARKALGGLFSEADLETFGILARQAAVALENSRLSEDLHAYVRRVEDSQRALIQVEKMAAVGRLMGTLAHEVNNPLQAVRNCLHLAVRSELSAEDRMLYTEMANSELDRLVEVVQLILEYYRQGKKEKESVLLEPVARRVVDLLATQLHQKGIIVHLEFPKTLAPVFVVKSQMQQVLFNLVVNAMDAVDEETPQESGKNRLPGNMLRERGQPKELWIEAEQNERIIRLRVEDSGPGIDLDLESHLFEPFISTKPNGTGLGLSISYSIIDQYGGSLRAVTARHGVGACFEITLPFKGAYELQE